MNPYYRIWLPNKKDPTRFEQEYLTDLTYAPDRPDLLRSYHLLLKDMREVFAYIDPCDSNEGTHSHRLYELLLRASTEFELNCKGILEANGYARAGNWNITDYFRLNNLLKLSSYTVRLDFWSPLPKLIQPLSEWNTGHSLTWYQDYNEVKHHRSSNFARASLRNAISAVGSVFSILFAQFGHYSTEFENSLLASGDNGDGTTSFAGSPFGIRTPPSSDWPPTDWYDFQWTSIKGLPNRFRKYSF